MKHNLREKTDMDYWKQTIINNIFLVENYVKIYSAIF